MLDGALDWFVHRAGRYERLEPDEHGVVRSWFFPGLWLDTSALLRGDLAGVLRVLDQGLATDQHSVFVRQLAERDARQS